MKSELQHYGVLGMRWGVRRYQNADGTLTEEGRRRRESNDYNNYTAIIREGSNITKKADTLSRKSADRKRKKEMEKLDVSEMSDKELKDKIERMNLERRYKELSTENIKTGKGHASDILETAGDVLAIGASAATIMLMIYKMGNM